MLATRAADNEVFVAYVNLVGGQDELVFDGGSMLADPTGEMLLVGNQFKEELLVIDLDVEAGLRSRLREPRPRKEPTNMLHEIGEAKLIKVTDFAQNSDLPSIPKRESCRLDLLGEVYEALVTADQPPHPSLSPTVLL